MSESNEDLLLEILKEAKANNASDIHLAPASPVMIRVDGALAPLNKYYLKPFEIENILEVMINENQKSELEEKGELDFAYSISGFSRIRVNAFRQRGTYAMAMRILSFEIPDAKAIGVPNSIINLVHKKKGLIIVTGAAGSGKSTTLAALIDEIAKNQSKNIITIEDPIEYLFKHGKSIVLQREIGGDTKSYDNALNAALREDPDVIFVGELKDLETISAAISAAENGHLVFSTLHKNTSAEAIDRLVDVFPMHQQQQVRVLLSEVLEGIIAQQLLPLKKSKGRIAAFEVMISNQNIRKLIREGKNYQIPSEMERFKKDGIRLMDDSVYDLYMKGLITGETAINYAHDKVVMNDRVQIK
ncbi:twitching motility protein PilT [Lachnospiraceae bacterium C7]|nr:twitching motility protein PilT [Lachnospiraceae bacterium C7]